MPSELDIFLSLPRRVRREISRDQARMLPVPPLPPRHGEIGLHVNAPRPMRTDPSSRSGQQRINTKRNARADFWFRFEIATSEGAEAHALDAGFDRVRQLNWAIPESAVEASVQAVQNLNKHLDAKFGQLPHPRY